jgi:hypothetical protein
MQLDDRCELLIDENVEHFYCLSPILRYRQHFVGLYFCRNLLPVLTGKDSLPFSQDAFDAVDPFEISVK